jgi:pyrroloquinoline quinone (PQQ) biosynthesis protein C
MDDASQAFVQALEQDSLALVDALDHHPLVGQVIRGEASADRYRAFLRATYHYVRWSGPLLAETAAGVRRDGRLPWLAEILDTKTREESPHDRWVLDDLAACGDNVELVKAATPPLPVSAYVDWSRSLAQAGSPGYLGAAYTLELISSRRAAMAAENLRARAAIPHIDSALSFLDGHGDTDLAHIAALHEVLAGIDEARDRAAIALCAAVMRTLYPLFFLQPGPTGTDAAG